MSRHYLGPETKKTQKDLNIGELVSGGQLSNYFLLASDLFSSKDLQRVAQNDVGVSEWLLY